MHNVELNCAFAFPYLAAGNYFNLLAISRGKHFCSKSLYTFFPFISVIIMATVQYHLLIIADNCISYNEPFHKLHFYISVSSMAYDFLMFLFSTAILPLPLIQGVSSCQLMAKECILSAG